MKVRLIFNEHNKTFLPLDALDALRIALLRVYLRKASGYNSDMFSYLKTDLQLTPWIQIMTQLTLHECSR